MRKTLKTAGVAPADAPPFSDWTISRFCWETMRPLLRPGMRTLEFGSGLSTLLFDAAGCRHTAVEHDPRFAAASNSVVIAPLSGHPGWYSWSPLGAIFDLIFVDGPPQCGRTGVLKVLGACITDCTLIVVDDTHRAEELALSRTIAGRFRMDLSDFHGDRRSFAICIPNCRNLESKLPS